MPAYGECQQAEIAAPPQACFDALTDYERLPQWQGAVRSVRVVEREPGANIVEYEVDAKVRTVRYRLREVLDEPFRIGSQYVGGDFRDFAGEWRFEELPSGATRAQLDLRIDPGRFVPGPVRGLIADAVLCRALGDLRTYVER